MKRFLFATLLGVAVLATAGPVLAEVASPVPEGSPEQVVVSTPPERAWP